MPKVGFHSDLASDVQDERVTPQHQSMAEALKDLQVYEWTATGKALAKKAAEWQTFRSFQFSLIWMYPRGQKPTSADHLVQGSFTRLIDIQIELLCLGSTWFNYQDKISSKSTVSTFAATMDDQVIQRPVGAIGQGFEGTASDWTEYVVWLVGFFALIWFIWQRNVMALPDDDFPAEDGESTTAETTQPKESKESATKKRK
eukprot:symbB.v1.2.019416.t1/scaffold1560.1/size111759/7